MNLITSAQSPTFSSTVTAGAGGGFPVAGYQALDYDNAPTFSGNYEFRLLRHLSAEVGIENMLPKQVSFSPHGSYTTRERLTLLPFGLRGVAALAGQRVELFAGTGGARLWRTEQGNSYNATTMFWQVNAGGRVALDHGRRFWVGTTIRFYRDLGRPTQQWLSLTGDFGFRLGH